MKVIPDWIQKIQQPACELWCTLHLSASEKTSQEAWDAAFADYDADTYLARAEAAETQSRQDKVNRLAKEAAADEKLNQERLARSKAEKALEIPETKGELEVSRFGSRYTDSKEGIRAGSDSL